MYRLLFACLLLGSINSFCQVYKDPHARVEDRVNSLLSQMTIEEKLDYIGGVDAFYIRGIERLGLPRIKMSDGPLGVRTWGQSTAYPATILAAASWDTTLVQQMGIALGKDAKARGVHILLAPGVNIFRASMGGRNFEYLGEDPYLTSRMAVNYIIGVQSQGVVATVKHFAGNNQEWDRNNVSSNIDERTLQEIYLPAFKAAVTEAHVGAVMNSYNLVNGVHATQNGHLNNDILKRSWGFKGVLMSDWRSTYDAEAITRNGLDLEMPSGKFMNRENLLPLINNHSLPEEIINDKVRRILRSIFSYGFYDKEQLDSSLPLENPASDAVALNIARGGIVLLKNEQHLLPFNASKIKTLAVIGPNANNFVTGGGSSITSPFHSVSVVKGLQTLLGDQVQITYIPVIADVSDFARHSVFYTHEGSSEKGLVAEYFSNIDLEGSPVGTRTETAIEHLWKKAPDVKDMPADSFSIRWTGVIRPEKTDVYRLTVKGDDGYRLFVDGQKVLDDWEDHAATTRTSDMQLEAGKEYKVRLEFYDRSKDAEIAFAWYPTASGMKEAVAAAQKADAAIVCMGFNSKTEHEGGDRTFNLPPLQDSIINMIAAANSKTVVILNAGGNVHMQPWINKIHALIHAWYPGQAGGTALAEILFGKTNPSGKLPASFEKEWKDNPVYNSYYDSAHNKQVVYKEGIFIGYRYWDRASTQPQFPFGYGLSYTSFQYSHLQVTNAGKAGNPQIQVSFTITNTGAYAGAEVAQLYVHQQGCTTPRPEKELKGFAKVFLQKGETKTVTLTLGASALSYFTEGNGFHYDPGMFDVLVGASSADIRLKGAAKVL